MELSSRYGMDVQKVHIKLITNR